MVLFENSTFFNRYVTCSISIDIFRIQICAAFDERSYHIFFTWKWINGNAPKPLLEKEKKHWITHLYRPPCEAVSILQCRLHLFQHHFQ